LAASKELAALAVVKTRPSGFFGAGPDYAGICLHARYFNPELGTFLSPDPLNPTLPVSALTLFGRELLGFSGVTLARARAARDGPRLG
jgi:hypothetical protein